MSIEFRKYWTAGPLSAADEAAAATETGGVPVSQFRLAVERILFCFRDA